MTACIVRGKAFIPPSGAKRGELHPVATHASGVFFALFWCGLPLGDFSTP